MIYSATVTSQGQLSIPVQIRRKLKLDKRRNVIIETQGEKIVITPEVDILELRGVFKTKKKIPFRVARKAFEKALGRGEV